MVDQLIEERTSTVPVTAKPSRGPIALIAVLALAVIGLGSWALVERNHAGDISADLTTAQAQITDLQAEAATATGDLATAQARIADLEAGVATTTDLVVVGGGPLTARQQEMVDLVAGPWISAWEAGDGEAVAAFFAPDGVLYDIEGDSVLTAVDGTLQGFASSWPGLQLAPGMAVHGDRMFAVVEVGGHEIGIVLDFTESGELLVDSLAMYDTVLGGQTAYSGALGPNS